MGQFSGVTENSSTIQSYPQKGIYQTQPKVSCCGTVFKIIKWDNKLSTVCACVLFTCLWWRRWHDRLKMIENKK